MFGCASRQPSSAATKTYTMPSWGDGAPRLQVDLPASFSMKRNEGPDFDVLYFSDASTKSSMGIYIGYNPGLHSSEAGVTDVQHHPGRVGEVSVEWLRWSKDGRRRSETLVQDFFGRSTARDYAGLVLHIFTGAPSERDVARMEAAAGTLRLEKAR